MERIHVEALAELGLTHLVYHVEMKVIQAAFFTEEDAREWLGSFLSEPQRIKYAWIVKGDDGLAMWYVTPGKVSNGS